MKNIFIIISIVYLFSMAPSFSYAQNPPQGSIQTPQGSINTPSGSNRQPPTLQNPIGENDPRVILGNILRVVLGLVGSIALVVFVFGGLTWMTSAGNSDRVTQGRDTLIWAAIGLIVIFASYTLVAFILQTITGT